jgi:hypothetical protein
MMGVETNPFSGGTGRASAVNVLVQHLEEIVQQLNVVIAAARQVDGLEALPPPKDPRRQPPPPPPKPGAYPTVPLTGYACAPGPKPTDKPTDKRKARPSRPSRPVPPR